MSNSDYVVGRAYGEIAPINSGLFEMLLKKAQRERDEIAALVRRLFDLLETVEVSDGEREFHPTYISSCRVMHTQELNELLPKLKEAAK